MNQNQGAEPKNIILAIVACIAFYWLYSTHLSKKYPRPERSPATEVVEGTQTSTSQTSGQMAAGSEAPSSDSQISIPEVPPPSRLSAEELRFESPQAYYELNQDTGGFSSIRLKDFMQDKRGSDPVELLDGDFFVQGTTSVLKPRLQPGGFSAKREGEQITFTRHEGVWQIDQEYTFNSKATDYGVSLKVTYTNTSSVQQELNAGLVTKTSIIPFESKSTGFIPGMNYERKTLVVGINNERDYEDTQSYCEDYADDRKPALQGVSENIDYLGFDGHYFLKVLQPSQNKMSYRLEKYEDDRPGDGCPLMAVTYQPQGFVQAGESVSLGYRYYFGPKEVPALEAFSPSLRSSLYLGWFGVIARPLLWAVKSLYNVFGNYGWAIIFVTLVLKMLFFPLTRAAQVSMKKMQKLQPQMTAIREKYKEDPRRQQQELMKFMAQNKINPAKGCLPILPQIPVFIAFYNVLSYAIELRHAPFFGWIQDLSVADPYLITPLLLGASMFLQQKLTPHPGMDKAQERIMMMMPIVFTVMMLSLPAGMVLYMLVNTIVSIIQQQWLNRSLA